MAHAKIDNFSEEELRQIVLNSTSIQEVSRKLGYTSKGSNYKTVQSRLDKYGISTEHFTCQAKKNLVRSPENVFIKDSSASQATLRRWYEKGNYSEYKCSICGLEPWWNDQPLVLTLDHINGDNHDDRLENLRWICPNCDRQLPTFAGKNNQPKEKEEKIKEEKIKKLQRKKYCIDCGIEISPNSIRCSECSYKYARIVERPEKEKLYQILKELNGNFTQAGKKFGVTDNAVRKWCKQYDLPFHSSDYK